MQAGVIQGGHVDSYATGVMGEHPSLASMHDLNMPYEGETPTAELLFPPTPVHTPLPTFSASGSVPEHPDVANTPDIAIGRPAPYMQPSPWVHQRPDMNIVMNPKLDMNVAYEGGDEEEPSNGHYLVTKDFLPPVIGKRKREDEAPPVLHFPQHDGAGDLPPKLSSEQGHIFKIQNTLLENASSSIRTSMDARNCCKRSVENHTCNKELQSSMFPQLDGVDDGYDDMVAVEDYNEPLAEDIPPSTEQLTAESRDLQPCKSEGEEQEDLEPPLNEDDDLDDVDFLHQGLENFQTEDVVYAQFEKVTRAKNKWKCVLKDGVMHLKHREYLFSRANGEFEF
ncbi:hypothetical protein KP509_14G063700 [Ceratopteris richardii]|nr:hypothetical protein KP509_14G063700 [Ceratopteris richardii]